MRFRTSGRASALAIAAGVVVAVGCSSSSPPPQAYVLVTLNPTNNGMCQGVAGTTPILAIGSMGTLPADPPMRVPEGGPIHISCDVKGSSPNFTISLSAKSDSTVTGGSMVITGSNISYTPAMGSTPASNAGGMGISGIFVGTANGEYDGSNCTLTYSYNGATSIGGIAPGRVWGHVSCPTATNGAITVDSNGDPSTCDVETDFVFENCGS